MTAPARNASLVADDHAHAHAHDDALVRRFLAQRAGEVPVEAVVLFGSRARGDATPASDVDLLLVTAGPPSQRSEAYAGQAFDVIHESFESLHEGAHQRAGGNNNIRLEILATGRLLVDTEGRVAPLMAAARRRFLAPAPATPPDWVEAERARLDAMGRSAGRLARSAVGPEAERAWRALASMRQDDALRRCVQAVYRLERRWSSAFPVLVMRGGLAPWPVLQQGWDRLLAAGDDVAARQAVIDEVVAWTSRQLEAHGSR